MMNDLLDRYDRLDDGSYVINTRVLSCNSLFNEFDFSSSLWKRDLREEYVEFLVDSVEEVGLKNNFVLQLSLPENEMDDGFSEKFSKAVTNYFLSLIHLSRKSIGHLINKIIINFLLSIVLLILVFFVGKNMEDRESMLYMIFNEGLYIAVWVLMWPVFSDFLFDLKKQMNKITIYKRFLNIRLILKKYKK